MDTNDRVKVIRKFFKLNQTDFAKRIGIKQSALSSIESKQSTVTERNIKAICDEYGINEQWLRTGEGQMQCEVTTDERLRTWVDEVLSGRPDNIRYAFLSVMSNLDEEGWKRIADFAEKVYLETHVTVQDETDIPADPEEDALQLAREIKESETPKEKLYRSDGQNIG